jgi:hypothetical protein
MTRMTMFSTALDNECVCQICFDVRYAGSCPCCGAHGDEPHAEDCDVLNIESDIEYCEAMKFAEAGSANNSPQGEQR